MKEPDFIYDERMPLESKVIGFRPGRVLSRPTHACRAPIERIALLAQRYARGEDLMTGLPLTAKDAHHWMRLQFGFEEQPETRRKPKGVAKQ